MTELGLGARHPAGEIRIGLRTGWVRSVVITMGGVSIVGLAIGLLNLAEKQPVQVFELLSRWGFVWLLVLVAIVVAWDLARVGLGYLGRLADSVQESAVAMNRIADRDDRDRDRMITETAFVGQRLERMAEEMREGSRKQQDHNEKVLLLLENLKK